MPQSVFAGTGGVKAHLPAVHKTNHKYLGSPYARSSTQRQRPRTELRVYRRPPAYGLKPPKKPAVTSSMSPLAVTCGGTKTSRGFMNTFSGWFACGDAASEQFSTVGADLDSCPPAALFMPLSVGLCEC